MSEPELKLVVDQTLTVFRGGEALPQLPTHKSRELLLGLAVRSEGITRETLAQELWPDTDRSSSLASLRQALALLRKSVGPEMIETNGDLVRLAAQPEVVVESTRFLGRCSADWCRSLLEGLRPPVPAQMVPSLAPLLRWYCERNPAGLNDFFHGCRAVLGSQLPHAMDELQEILAPHTHLLDEENEAFWRFQLVLLRYCQGQLFVAERESRQLLRLLAKNLRSPLLSATVVFRAGILGDLQRERDANQLLDQFGEIAKSPAERSRLLHSRAIVLWGEGDWHEYLKLINQANELADGSEPADFRHIQSNLSLLTFDLASQEIDAAKLDRMQAEATNEGDWRVALVFELAKSLSKIRDGDGLGAAQILEKLIQESSHYSVPRLDLILTEYLALAYAKSGEKALAAKALKETNRVRRHLGVRRSKLERLRLKEFGLGD